MALTLVSAPVDPRTEALAALTQKINQLREESDRILGTMERAMFRMLTQGPDVNLDGLSVGGNWQELVAEVLELQEALHALPDSK